MHELMNVLNAKTIKIWSCYEIIAWVSIVDYLDVIWVNKAFL